MCIYLAHNTHRLGEREKITGLNLRWEKEMLLNCLHHRLVPIFCIFTCKESNHITIFGVIGSKLSFSNLTFFFKSILISYLKSDEIYDGCICILKESFVLNECNSFLIQNSTTIRFFFYRKLHNSFSFLKFETTKIILIKLMIK